MARRRKSNYLEGLGYLNARIGTGTAPVAPGIGYTKGPSPSVPGGLAIPPIMPDPHEPTIQIGNQVWMSKNLKATHYRNGHPIPLTIDSDLWRYKTTGGRCVYDNDESNSEDLQEIVDTYGYLYNWYAAADRRGICPEGFHVPTDAEFTVLKDFITNDGYDDTEGGALKEIGDEHWDTAGGLDVYGFTALPGGYRRPVPFNWGPYYRMGNSGYFWSSTSYGPGRGLHRKLHHAHPVFFRYDNDSRHGFSVRCIAD